MEILGPCAMFPGVVLPIANSKGNPFSGGYKYTGWEKLTIFDGNRRLSRKWCEMVTMER